MIGERVVRDTAESGVVLEASVPIPGSGISSFPSEIGRPLCTKEPAASGHLRWWPSQNLESIPGDSPGLRALDWGDPEVVFLPLLPRPLATRTSVPEAEVWQELFQALEEGIRKPNHWPSLI